MVKVKLLVWERDEDWRWRGMPAVKIGQFCLNAMQATSGAWYIVGHHPRYETFEEVKAAGQSIYEGYILGQIETQHA